MEIGDAEDIVHNDIQVDYAFYLTVVVYKLSHSGYNRFVNKGVI